MDWWRKSLWLAGSLAVHTTVLAFMDPSDRTPQKVSLEKGKTSFEAAFVRLEKPAAAIPEPIEQEKISPPETIAHHNPLRNTAEEVAPAEETPPTPAEKPVPQTPPVEKFPPPEETPELPEIKSPTEPTPEASTKAEPQPDPLVETPEPSTETHEALAQSLPAKEQQGSENETPPHALQQPTPPYPAIARRRNLEGEVELAVHICCQGHPRKVEVAKSSGYPFFDRAALTTVRDQWRFNRGTCPYKPLKVTVRFSLQ